MKSEQGSERMPQLVFTESAALSLGVELELQILNTRDFNLTRGSSDLLALAEKLPPPGDIKPEITESMIEVSTGVHSRYATLIKELIGMRDALAGYSEKLNLAIAGGGTHPFQKWSEQRIFPKERFQHISDLYGYLAKQFTIFGQHIHIGCASGDDAVYLAHAMARYIPHFIALSASSPFSQGVDTAFNSSRLNAVSVFPLSGTLPMVRDWKGFNAYFDEMVSLGIVESMKDFYWDIRPKPEFGTIEIRVPDTPLTVQRAAALAAYAQTLAARLLAERSAQPQRAMYQVYTYNRFTACRFGLGASLIDAQARRQITLQEDITTTIDALASYAHQLDTLAPLHELRMSAAAGQNDATFLRAAYEKSRSLIDVAHMQSEMWMGKPSA
jgi:carboxylate-amine ligase